MSTCTISNVTWTDVSVLKISLYIPQRCVMYKGSNMIVCVLLMSNSIRRSRGSSPSDLPAARQHPREFDTNNTHTIMFDPIITWCRHFFNSYQYSAHQKQSKVWIESNHSLRCHLTTLSWWQVIAVASIPGRENARASFCGRLSAWNRTAPDRRHLLPVASTKLIMRCV